LVRNARTARGLSPEKAAEATPIRLKGGRWRQIEAGYERLRPTVKTVTAPPGTLAHMARVVGLTPERLEEVGRRDAAEILREILRQEREQAEDEPVLPNLTDEHERTVWEMPGVPEDARRRMIEIVREIRAMQGEDRGQQTG
jgi:transcriptional regulator with XRE-family HTH domain